MFNDVRRMYADGMMTCMVMLITMVKLMMTMTVSLKRGHKRYTNSRLPLAAAYLNPSPRAHFRIFTK